MNSSNAPLDLVIDAVVKENLINDLKPDINNFLYSRLPTTLTLGEMEFLACKIHDLIWETWNEP
jgi:hypothetical protein